MGTSFHVIFLWKGARMRGAASPQPVPESAVVTKGVLRAASRLGLTNRIVASVLGLSEASVSRMGSGTFVLSRHEKSFELAVLFLRLFRSLDSIVAGDDMAARAWLRNENAVLGGTPAALIQSVAGLTTVVGYLDSRRALV
jgi:hypothetical protein